MHSLLHMRRWKPGTKGRERKQSLLCQHVTQTEQHARLIALPPMHIIITAPHT